MKNLGHGADVNSMANKYNKDLNNIIDFSSNINPKTINNIETYILEGLKNLKSYPDINYTSLKNNISNYIKVSPEFIVPGNGATEIIYLLMKSIGKRIAILNPTFSEYERSARLNNLEVINIELNSKENFEINIQEIKDNINKFDSLFICNPNNPNGNVKDITLLLELLSSHNKLLIVDETFMEFVKNNHSYSLLKFVNQYSNIFIIKAVTKFFGIPGIRLGYGVTSNKDILTNIYKYKEPWTINSFADHISNYLFEDIGYIEESKRYFEDEIEYMVNELRKIKKIQVYDTNVNFILIKLKEMSASNLKDVLFKDYNILIRDASNFVGLNDSYIRVAIKSHEENINLINIMRFILDN